MSPLRRGGGHIVFGVDRVGVCVAFCLHAMAVCEIPALFVVF